MAELHGYEAAAIINRKINKILDEAWEPNWANSPLPEDQAVELMRFQRTIEIHTKLLGIPARQFWHKFPPPDTDEETLF